MRTRIWKSTRKKTGGYAERDSLKRKAFLRLRERYHRRGKSLVYVDESGFERQVVCRYGRAPRREKVCGLRAGHKETSHVLDRCAHGGSRIRRTVSVFRHMRCTDVQRVARNVSMSLINYTNVVVIDNAQFHKSEETRQHIEGRGDVKVIPARQDVLSPGFWRCFR
mgnify:CR=1 FL=1